MSTRVIILGSTSVNRKELLERLQIPFVQISPRYEEISIAGESTPAMALRLAEGKARSVPVSAYEEYVVIGSDEVAHVDGIILPKPGNHETAMLQLQQSSGRWVTFTTALCLLNEKQELLSAVEDYQVKFRQLSRRDIQRYLVREQPWCSAGSLKAESLGITMLENARGRDITALYGLPLMLLQDLLSGMDVDITDLE